MICLTYLSVFAFCLAFSAAVEEVQEGSTPPPAPASEDVAHRELTDSGYVIRYGDALYRYPFRIVPLVRRIQTGEKNPTETNEIGNEEEDKRRPLFYFTTYEAADREGAETRQGLPTSRPYIEIRKKRNVENEEIPESSKVGKLRRKRTYCHKCGGGGGGYGGYAIPVTYAVYPVYTAYPVSYGGGGKGCNTCGGGGGGGGTYSYSSSSAKSSSGSYSWGKK